MNDSTNVRVIADNIRKLNSRASNLEDAAAKIPKDLSTTETNTGVKWIDGKDIYQIVLSGKLPIIESSSVNVLVSENFDADIIIERFELVYDVSGNQHCDQHYIKYYTTNKHLEIAGLGSGFTECNYVLVLFYTKPTPVPSETSTKKKTTRKDKSE